MTNEVLATTSRASLATPLTAIREASASTGVDFAYLVKTAERESSLDPTAKASTSSASGLFQFIEQTWLGAVKDHGEKYGLADEAAAITRGQNGRLTVEDSQTRQQILDLRFNAQHAAALAGELAADNQAGLERKLGRALESGAAGNGALYAAHFLGLNGAVKLLSADENTEAASIFPAAAKANKPVFYDGNRAKTVGELIASFEDEFRVQSPNNVASAGIDNRQPPQTAGTTFAGITYEANINDASRYTAGAFGQGNFDVASLLAPTANTAHSRADINSARDVQSGSRAQSQARTQAQTKAVDDSTASSNITDPKITGPNITGPIQNPTSVRHAIPDIDQQLSPIALQVLLSLDPAILRDRPHNQSSLR